MREPLCAEPGESGILGRLDDVPIMNTNGKLTARDLVTARKRLLQMHYESGVGHIGGNLSALDALMLVFHEYLGVDDKFILSKGHSAGALYTTLWSVGRLGDEDLKLFHKDNTLLPGHPPPHGIDDILFATGSLGHGLSLAAGTALALKFKRSEGRVICLMSDGEWQEGSTWEALIFARHHRLANLTVLVDHNNLQGFGTTGEVASMSPLPEKLRGFDVDVVEVDGHDADEIRDSLAGASSRLRIVVLHTVKGRGVSFMEGRMEWHYLALREDQYRAAIAELEAG
jgi:transketolase